MLGTGDLLSRGVLTCAPCLLRIGSRIGPLVGSHLREDSKGFGPDRQRFFSTLQMDPRQIIEHALTFLRYSTFDIFPLSDFERYVSPFGGSDCCSTFTCSSNNKLIDAFSRSKGKESTQPKSLVSSYKQQPTCHPCT